MKVAFIISFLEKSSGFEQLFAHLMFNKLDFHVILINKNESELSGNLSQMGIPVTELKYSGKKSIPRLIWQTRRILKEQQISIVHTHLLEAGFIGGFASWLTRIPRRIYTRHHGDFHLFEAKRGKLYDRIIHSFYDTIVCLSSSHAKFLRKQEKIGDKLVYIPNFVDPQIFQISDETRQYIREKYNFSDNHINIGINARWTEWKGLQYILPAIIQYRKKTATPCHIYLFNAHGNDSEQIEQLLQNIPDSDYTATPFEPKIMAVYPELDLFIHCPIREASESFGLVYVEALGSGTPSILTLSGIAQDIVIPDENAIIVDYCNSKQIEEAIEKLINNPEIRHKFSENASQIRELFTLNRHADSLLRMYERKN